MSAQGGARPEVTPGPKVVPFENGGCPRVWSRPIHRAPEPDARAARGQGEAEFENVVLVYYPGVRFFADMVQSEFFQGIVGDKQLGDTQSTITVPVLDRL